MMKKKIKNTVTVIQKCLKILWKTSKASCCGIIVVSAFLGAMTPITMYVSKIMLDVLSTAFIDFAMTIAVFGAVALLLLTNTIAEVLTSFNMLINKFFSDRVALEINSLILCKCIELDMEYYDDAKTYDKISMAVEETPYRVAGLTDILSNVIHDTVKMFGVSSIVVLLDWKITMACVAISIPLFVFQQKISEFWFKIAIERKEKVRLSTVLRHIILKNDYVKELKLFDTTKYLKNIIIEQERNFQREDRKNHINFSLHQNLYKFFSGIVTAGIKLVVIYMSIQNKATIGAANMYISAVDQIKGVIASMLSTLSSAYENNLYLDALFDILEIKLPGDSLLPINNPINKIEFYHVSFYYPNTNKCVIKDFSYTFVSGHTYALIGLNGAGKTTLVKLMLNLYKPSSGKILVNGVDISLISGQSMRKHFSAVFQDFIKYPLSVADNIAVGNNKDDNNATVKKAAEFALADEFIDTLEKRYETQLQREWNNGVELSSGQWQKIALARCAYRKSDVQIFDEPFSAMDTLSECKVIEKMRTKKSNQITLFITHRYSSLSLADEILVMRNGQLVEFGSHNKLIDLCGYYEELYTAQVAPIINHTNSPAEE